LAVFVLPILLVAYALALERRKKDIK